MSEKDRQTKLVGLRLEHRRLQQEEKQDEANEMISKLLGDQKGNYKKAMNKNDVILRYLNINVVIIIIIIIFIRYQSYILIKHDKNNKHN